MNRTRQLRLVASVELNGDLLHRRGEVGGDSDLDLFGVDKAVPRRAVPRRARTKAGFLNMADLLSVADGEDDMRGLDQRAGALAFLEAELVDAFVGDGGGNQLAACRPATRRPATVVTSLQQRTFTWRKVAGRWSPWPRSPLSGADRRTAP